MKALVPQIAATQDFIGQTSAISTTTIFTPSSDGTFEVVALCYNNTTDAASGNNGQLFVSWTNEQGTNLSKQAIEDLNYEMIFSRFIRLKASQPLQIYTTLAGSGPWSYDVFVVVIRLE